MASLLLDHNLLPRLAALLRRTGHAVTTARDLHLDQAADKEILLFAARAGLIVVTADSDFIDLHTAGTTPHAGIFLVTPIAQNPSAQAREIATALDWLANSAYPLANALYRLLGTGTWERWEESAYGWVPLPSTPDPP